MTGRIRTVKPEWLEDERIGAASDAARVLSIALILVADDYGRGRASPAHLASAAWSYELERNDGDNAPEVLRKVSGALRDLAAMHFVTLYSVDGQRYFEIRNWEKHQKVSHKGKERVPAPSAVIPNASAEPVEPPETLVRPSGKSPETLVPDLRPGSPTTTTTRSSDRSGEAVPSTPTGTARALHHDLGVIQQAGLDAFKAVGAIAPMGMRGESPKALQDLVEPLRELSLTERQPLQRVAERLFAGFTASPRAKKAGYPLGYLRANPNEYLTRAAGPSDFSHVDPSINAADLLVDD